MRSLFLNLIGNLFKKLKIFWHFWFLLSEGLYNISRYETMFEKIAEKFKKKSNFPDDADGNVLRGLVDRGVDLSRPCVVEFFITIPNESKGKELLKILEENNFKDCRLYHNVPDEHYDFEDSWDIIYTKKFVITYDEIVNIQNKLDELSKPFDSHIDGWGTFGPKQD